MNRDETHTEQEPEEVVIEDISVYEEKSNNIPEADASQDEGIPQLFSDEESSLSSSGDNLNENFKNEEEEFEIPAFLRKQKF